MSHSPNYTIEDAYSAKWSNPGIHFYTPDLKGVIAGQMGGPLWINFVNGRARSHCPPARVLVPKVTSEKGVGSSTGGWMGLSLDALGLSE